MFTRDTTPTDVSTTSLKSWENIYATGFLHNSNLKKAGRLNMYQKPYILFFYNMFYLQFEME